MNNKVEELRKLNQELEVAKLNKDHRIEDRLQSELARLEEKKDVISYIIDTYNELKKYNNTIVYIQINGQVEKCCCFELGVDKNYLWFGYYPYFTCGNRDYWHIRKDLSINMANYDRTERPIDNKTFVNCPTYLGLLSVIIDNLDNLKVELDSCVEHAINDMKKAIDDTNADAKYGGM